MQTAAPGPGEAKHMPVFGLGRDTSGRDDNHNERLYGGRESKDSSIAALEAFQREYLPSLVAGFPAPAPASQRLPAPPPPPRHASPPSCSPPLVQVGAESLHTSHTFDEQFKDLYEIDDNPRRREFLDDLFGFMTKRGTPINRLPVMAKHVLDLYELFNRVVERGGLVEVIHKKQWQEIIRDLKLPSSITSAAFTLRTQYTRYLYPYECKMKNLSKPSDLNAAVEGQRREGRRGYEDTGPLLLGPGQPFPYPGLPGLPLLRPPTSEDPAPRPLLPPVPTSLNPLDVTRLTLMKIMGHNSMSSFLPPPLPLPSLPGRGSTEDKLQSPSPGPKLASREGKQSSEDGSSVEEEDKKKMIVCIEINSIKYQGILFAQPPSGKSALHT